MVKNPQETQVRSLGLEDPLEKGTATPSSRIPMPIESPWAEEPGGLRSMESQESDATEVT